jgi:hypothetical protein
MTDKRIEFIIENPINHQLRLTFGSEETWLTVQAVYVMMGLEHTCRNEQRRSFSFKFDDGVKLVEKLNRINNHLALDKEYKDWGITDVHI